MHQLDFDIVETAFGAAVPRGAIACNSPHEQAAPGLLVKWRFYDSQSPDPVQFSALRRPHHSSV